jgi:hypothetical protein
MNRRAFLKHSAAGIGGLVAADGLLAGPLILTRQKFKRRTTQGELVFRPYFVQDGQGPHLGMVENLQNIGERDWKFPQWVFASDEHWDTFYSNTFSRPDGVHVSDIGGRDRFGINVRWNVEGFGFIYMTADNGGEFYSLPAAGDTADYNLNFELAKSRVVKNRDRLAAFSSAGYEPSSDVRAFLDLSDEYYEAAQKASGEEARAQQAQKALYYAMWGGEMLEIDKAETDIRANPHRADFFIGCDTKGYPYMDSDLFIELFTNVFNYATITHYLTSFEKEEGVYDWTLRDEQFRKLRDRGVEVEGRPIFWADGCCSPDWLIDKSYPELLKYVEKHTRDVVSHYGDEMYAWEVTNEAHDYANILGLTPDQMVEIAGLICDVAKDTNPNVHRLINVCCIQADYIQFIDWSKYDRDLELITPHQYIRMCHEAGVDFTITGQQLYYPYTNRDLADTIRMTERLEQYSRPVQITEIGATSGPTAESIASGELPLPDLPYSWHRHWDPELQAEWLEQIYTILYSKPWIEAINWYDFVDPYSFVDNGGLLASPEGEKKPVYHRLEKLQKEWKSMAG